MVRLLATELRMTDYVLTGLVKRRAELAGEIEERHNRLRKMIEDLEKLDSVTGRGQASRFVSLGAGTCRFALLAQECVHLRCGNRGIDIAEGAVFPHFLRRVQ